MDLVDAIPPPIGRSPRATSELQAELEDMLDELRFKDVDDDSDDAAPPPIRRSRSTSLDSAISVNHNKRMSRPPLPRKSSQRIDNAPDLLPEPLRLPKRQKTEPSWVTQRIVPESPRIAQKKEPVSPRNVEGRQQLDRSPTVQSSPPAPAPAQRRHIADLIRTSPQPTSKLVQIPSRESAKNANSTRTILQPNPNPSQTTGRPSVSDAVQPSEDRLAQLEESLSQHTRNFSHPFSKRLPTSHRLATKDLRKPLPKAPSPRHKYYRTNSKLPPSLRRWSSLETIDSVATAPEAQDETPNEAPAERSSLESTSTGAAGGDEEDDGDKSPTPQSRLSLASAGDSSSGSGSIRPSESNSRRPSRSSSIQTISNQHSDGSSLLRKLKLKKIQEPLLEPAHLEIEKTVSLEQSSIHRASVHRTDSSSSIGTISSGRPSLIAYPSSEGSRDSRSTNKEDWKASHFDISHLTEAELKKCKKRGINPALYAEMKAAKKGKWASPIGGNTFL